MKSEFRIFGLFFISNFFNISEGLKNFMADRSVYALTSIIIGSTVYLLKTDPSMLPDRFPV